MARFSVFLISAAAIALLGMGAYVVLTYSAVGTPGAVATTTISASTTAYIVDAEYPRFGIAPVDQQVKAIYEKAVAELEAQETVMHGDMPAQNSFTGRFDRVYVGPDIISAELILETYTGGAHPGTLFEGVAFDRASGTRLTLQDALALIGKDLPAVAREARQSLSQQLGDTFAFPEGTDPKPENYQYFVVSKDTVTFIFGQYQVAPYAAGQQYVSFPRVK